MAKPLNPYAPEFTQVPSTIGPAGGCYYQPPSLNPFLCFPPTIDSCSLYYQYPQGFFILCCSPPPTHDPYCYYASPLLPATSVTLSELPETTGQEECVVMEAEVQLPAVTCKNISVSNRIRNGPRCYSGSATRKAVLPPPMYRRLRKLPGTLASDYHVRDGDREAPSNKTTLMIRNIPNKFNKEKLIQILDDHCRLENQKLRSEDNAVSEFDFVYLPMDFGSGNNLGYAFVNFTNPSAAWKLYCKFQLKGWGAFGSGKVCEVTYARLQGLSELKLHFKNSVFTCNALDYLPSCYVPARNGCRSTKRCYIGKFVPSFG